MGWTREEAYAFNRQVLNGEAVHFDRFNYDAR